MTRCADLGGLIVRHCQTEKVRESFSSVGPWSLNEIKSEVCDVGSASRN
jgi:hypothetical protein